MNDEKNIEFIKDDDSKEPRTKPMKFNVGADQLQMLTSLMWEARYAMTKYDNIKWFKCLNGLRNLLSYEISQSESDMKLLKEYERAIYEKMRRLRVSHSIEDYEGNSQSNGIVNAKLRGIVEDYNMVIFRILEKLGMLSPRKSRQRLFG